MDGCHFSLVVLRSVGFRPNYSSIGHSTTDKSLNRDLIEIDRLPTADIMCI
jgi:hypothetical protein